MPALRGSLNPQARNSRNDEHTVAPNDRPCRSVTHSLHDFFGDDVAQSAHNPFGLSGQTTTVPLEMSEESTSGDILKERLVREPQHRSGDLEGSRLPRYSTLLPPSGCGMHPVGNVTASMGAKMTSPAPRYTAEKQSAFRSNVASVVEEHEKADFRSSPVQEQNQSLPFHRDEDVEFVQMGGAHLNNKLNMETEIPHLYAVNTKEYERYKRGHC